MARFLVVALLVAFPTMQGRAAEPAALRVLAAASLAEVLPRVAALWTGQGNPPVLLAFDASSRLARQVEAGAPADVFVSADRAWMDTLAGRGAVLGHSRVELAGNRLVVVVPTRFTGALASGADLAGPTVRHLALAGEHVPAGTYAQEALVRLGAWPAVAPRVVRGDSVRTALAWVATGQADAGIVYATDARVEPRVRVAWVVPETVHAAIRYPAAVTTTSTRPEAAAAFLAFCRSDAAVRMFDDAGFTRVSPP
ncbi:MAG: molybdate transporter substrate-binding protein [Pseudomonadota bacterium]|jgi:molybdate transport system substrate-binding protein